MQKNKLILVGVKEEGSEDISHIKAFANAKWADKYAKAFGAYAVFAEVDLSITSFSNTVPADIDRLRNEANSTQKD